MEIDAVNKSLNHFSIIESLRIANTSKIKMAQQKLCVINIIEHKKVTL